MTTRRPPGPLAGLALVVVSAVACLAGCVRTATEVDGQPKADAELVAIRAQIADLHPGARLDTIVLTGQTDAAASVVWALDDGRWCAAAYTSVDGTAFDDNGGVALLRTVPVCAAVIESG